jgi:hypothetical protein
MRPRPCRLQDGQREGIGVKTYSDGSMYDGFWRSGRKHGIGVFRPAVQHPAANTWQSTALDADAEPGHAHAHAHGSPLASGGGRLRSERPGGAGGAWPRWRHARLFGGEALGAGGAAAARAWAEARAALASGDAPPAPPPSPLRRPGHSAASTGALLLQVARPGWRPGCPTGPQSSTCLRWRSTRSRPRLQLLLLLLLLRGASPARPRSSSGGRPARAHARARPGQGCCCGLCQAACQAGRAGSGPGPD